MDSVSDIPTDAKGFSGFFKYVFDFDETNKALMFNMIQYSVLAIIPIVLVLKGIGYVIPEDVRSVAADVLRHRIGLTYEAEAEEINSDQIIKEIIDKVQVP